MEGEVLAPLVPSETSEAVTVWLPAVLNVTLKAFVPETSAALAGKMALVSEQVMPTVSLVVLTRFQFESTALTVTLKAVPAVRAVGVPVLPVALPGEAVSPGTNNNSLANAAGLMAIESEVAPVRPLLEKLIVMLVATLWARLANVTTPATAVRVVVPCKVPLPALRVAVTAVVLPLARRLPKAS